MKNKKIVIGVVAAVVVIAVAVLSSNTKLFQGSFKKGQFKIPKETVVDLPPLRMLLPDLVVTSADITGVLDGTSTLVTDTGTGTPVRGMIQNIGEGALTGPIESRFFISNSRREIILWSEPVIAHPRIGIGVGEFGYVDSVYRFLGNTLFPPGTYELGLCVNWGDRVRESNTGNNCLEFGETFHIDPLPE